MPLSICAYFFLGGRGHLPHNIFHLWSLIMYTFFYYKNQIIFAEALEWHLSQFFTPTLPPIMPLKCIWEHVLSFSTFHFLQRWLVFDLVLQILLNLRLSFLIKFVLIKINVYHMTPESAVGDPQMHSPEFCTCTP